MPTKKQEDIEKGLNSEEKLLPKLQKKFGSELERSTDKYSPYDFRKKGVRIELKTRNNASNRYPTTMIGLSKVRHAESFSGKYYFFFAFTDGIKYIRYDEDVFREFQIGLGGRSDRGKVESNTYVYIPVDALKDF
jgi:hypothetical protein